MLPTLPPASGAREGARGSPPLPGPVHGQPPAPRQPRKDSPRDVRTPSTFPRPLSERAPVSSHALGGLGLTRPVVIC